MSADACYQQFYGLGTHPGSQDTVGWSWRTASLDMALDRRSARKTGHLGDLVCQRFDITYIL